MFPGLGRKVCWRGERLTIAPKIMIENYGRCQPHQIPVKSGACQAATDQRQYRGKEEKRGRRCERGGGIETGRERERVRAGETKRKRHKEREKESKRKCEWRKEKRDGLMEERRRRRIISR